MGLKAWCSLVVFALVSVKLGAQTLSPDKKWWTTNGRVNAIVQDTALNIAYVAGRFDVIAPAIRYGARLDAISGEADTAMAQPNNIVRATVADPDGGFFIAGDFTMVGDQPRYFVAHFDSAGVLTPWAPRVDGPVTALALRNDSLFIGGSFGSVNGEARHGLALIDASTGISPAWSNGVTGDISSISLNAQRLYVSGNTSLIDFNEPDQIIAFDIPTGNRLSWHASITGRFRNVAANDQAVIAISGEYAYVFDGTTGNLNYSKHTTLGIGEFLACLLLRGDTVFIGGAMDYFGNSPTTGTVGMQVSTGTVFPATPTNGIGTFPDYALAIEGDTLYCGGTFYSVGYETSPKRARISAFSISTGEILEWKPASGGAIFSLASKNGQVYAGGNFSCIGGYAQENIAALDMNTGRAIPNWSPLTTWPSLSGDEVTAMVLGEDHRLTVSDTYYNSGELVSLDPPPALTRSAWNPAHLLPDITSLALKGDTLFVGGRSELADSLVRPNLQALSAVDFGATAFNWHPNIRGTVSSLLISDSTLYVGGSFDAVNHTPRSNLAAVHTNSGALLPWAPEPDGPVNALYYQNGLVYLGGDFSYVGATPHHDLARVVASSGVVSTWSPEIDTTIYAIAVHGNRVFAIGGTYHGASPLADRMVMLDAADAQSTFDISSVPSLIQGRATALCITPNSVLVGASSTSAIVNEYYPTELSAFKLSTCDQDPTSLSIPGSPCDDGDTLTTGEVWGADCTCGVMAPDCLGIPGGSESNGTPCNDANDHTVNDTWSVDCICIGTIQDCMGILNGTALPGTPCDDGDQFTINDEWTEDCVCLGQQVDCLGVLGGSALPGILCDDGDSLTLHDVWNTNCECVGLYHVGIDEITEHAQLRAWPIPNAGNMLFLSAPVSGLIMDNSGRVVRSFFRTSGIDIQSLESGVYVLRTNSGEILRFIRYRQ